MSLRTAVVLCLLGLPADVNAQRTESVDSLVGYWLKRGTLANWSPARLFTGCPNLEPWQRRGIDRLLGAGLSLERIRDLAAEWVSPLKGCRDPRLEQWYFDQVNAAIHRGEGEVRMDVFWTALDRADSPRIREFLRTLMTDLKKAELYRELAGTALFLKLRPQERLSEYVRGFEGRHLPYGVAIGQADALLAHDADRLLREVGQRVRVNVTLADQPAFRQVAQGSGRLASPAARRNLGEALEVGLRQRGLTDSQRIQLEAHVQLLRRPPT